MTNASSGGNGKQMSSSDMTRRMVCGGLAGMIAKTATNPLERIKMLSQTGEHGITAAVVTAGGRRQAPAPAHPSILALYRNIVHAEGILGLWAGNGANLLRVFPAKSIVFATNDMYKNMLQNILPASAPVSFLAGGFAGMTASSCTYPLDFARGRISGKLAAPKVADGAPKKHYHGIIRTIVLTVKDEGFLALYKGVTPTLLGAMPYEGIKFGTVGLLEQLFPVQPNVDHAPSYFATRKMFMGGMGGVMAGLITYPNDTVRRLLQLQGSRGTTTQYKGYWDCVHVTYREHGITRFYRGLTINIIRMAPNAAVQFGSYELLKRWTSDLL